MLISICFSSDRDPVFERSKHSRSDSSQDVQIDLERHLEEEQRKRLELEKTLHIIQEQLRQQDIEVSVNGQVHLLYVKFTSCCALIRTG